jgi:hypothetical protein
LRERLASRRQLEESAKVFRGFHAHDELLQLLALILADDITAKRREFDRDFFDPEAELPTTCRKRPWI